MELKIPIYAIYKHNNNINMYYFSPYNLSLTSRSWKIRFSFFWNRSHKE